MVLYTFRNVNSKSFKLEIDPATPIAEVKKLIQTELKTDAALKLIFKCKILKDEDLMESLKVGPSDFIVVYVSGPKKPAPAPAAEPAPAPAPAAEPAPAPAPAPAPQGPTVAPLPEIVRPPPQQPQRPQQPGAAAGDIENSPEFRANLQSLIELGFEQSQCEAALKAAFGDVDRAAEYLFNGSIPEAGDDNGPPPDGVYQIGQLLSAYPGALENVIRALEQQNPNAGALFRQQPEIFLSELGLDPSRFDCDSVRNRTAQPMPAEPMPMPMPAAPQPMPAAPQPMPAAPQPMPAAPQNAGAGILARYSAEDQASIRRIQEFTGAPLQIVIQCFEACDKNEEMACNLVFQMND